MRNALVTPMPAHSLTDRQRQVLGALEEAIRLHGYGPSVRELAEAFQITFSAMIKHLEALRRKGLITREVATWRAVRLTDLGVSELRR